MQLCIPDDPQTHCASPENLEIRKKPPGKILSGKIYLELLETVSAGLLNIGLQCGNAAHHLGFLTIHYD